MSVDIHVVIIYLRWNSDEHHLLSVYETCHHRISHKDKIETNKIITLMFVIQAFDVYTMCM